MRQTGAGGLAVLKFYEQLRLVAYADPASPREVARRAGKPASVYMQLSPDPWTVGYGDTGPDVVEGLTIDEAQADARLAKRLVREFEPAVNRLVKVPLSQCQFDALVCWTYNLGVGSLSFSTMLAKLNAGLYDAAAEEMLKWNRGGGKVLLGLRRRRASEYALYFGAPAIEAIRTGQAIT